MLTARCTAALVAIVLQPCCVWASDLLFSGSVVRIGRETISIRLADRRIVEARFLEGSAAAQNKPGDEVEITCKSIYRVWEEETSSYEFLELTNVRVLRRPSQEEASKVQRVPPTSTEAASKPADKKLEHARQVNLQYVSRMPNFVADETARRYKMDAGMRQWRFMDTIETEIAFTGNQAVRRQIRKDGKPWERPFQALPGFKWSGGFGAEIRTIFDLQCPTSVSSEAPAEVRGKKLLEYRFTSPEDGCFSPFYAGYQRYNPARTGHVYIEDPGGNMIQLDEEATEFPTEFEFTQGREEVQWDYVKIGEVSHLLPVAANFLASYSSGIRWRVEVEFRNHRHFEASTSISYK